MPNPMSLPRRWSTGTVRSALLACLRVFGLLVLVGGYGQTAFGQTPPTADHAGPIHFSTQTRIGFHSGDDWEPAIAADRFGHVYALYKHYDVAGGQTCPGCDLHLLVQRSSDGGQTWDDPRPIAPGPVHGGQYDSQIVVDPLDGRTVWASFLQGNNSLIAVVKSTDFGQTWTNPKIVSTQPPGLDKDEMVVRGNMIVVAYDDNLNTFASISLDGGAHWDSRMIFAGDARINVPLSAGTVIDSQGNIFISWNSYDKAHSTNGDGPATLFLSKSTDLGQHWTRQLIDVSGAAPICANCGFAFYGAQMAIQVGSDDSLYLLWNGSVDQTNFVPARMFFARSTDHGRTFSPRQDVSDAPQGAEHAFPALAAGSQAGDVRLSWMDTRTGAWNVVYRASRDGGATFSPTAHVSSVVPGYAYLTQAGFGSPYGDYFMMVVDGAGLTQMAFGEGPNYAGPGNIWVSHAVGN